MHKKSNEIKIQRQIILPVGSSYKCKQAMPSLTVRLQPSKRLAWVLTAAHFLAMGILWPLDLTLITKFAILILLIISLIYSIRHHALLNTKNAIVAFELTDAMQCKFETRSGQSIICYILGSTFVTPHLVVLNLQPLGHFLTRSIVILPDGIDAEIFRQLRVLLRWKWKDSNAKPDKSKPQTKN